MSTPRPPEHDLERLLEADRGEFAALYDRLSRAEPPRRLDRAVLAEASRVALGPQSSRTHRWMLGLGSAAGLVLAAGIAWQVGQQREAKEAAPAASARPRAGDVVVPVQPITPRSPPAAQEAPAPSAGAAPETAPVVVEKKREMAQRRAVPPKPAPPPPPVAPTPAPSAATEASAPAPASVPAEPLREEADAFSDDAAKAAVPEPQRARDAQPDGEREGMGMSKQDAVTGSRIGAGSRATSTPTAPTTSVQLRSNMQLDPEDWLAEILRLDGAGRRQEAIENLRLFRRMHPEWPIGDRLHRLLE